MRIETTKWTVSGASKIGHAHRFKDSNCQDAYAFTVEQEPERVIAFVSDGCSEGEHSEVGAKLLTRFAVRETKLLFSRGYTLNEVIQNLFSNVLSFINLNTQLICGDDPVERALYLKHYFSATLLGAILTPDEGEVFYAGDGVFSAELENPELNPDATFWGHVKIQQNDLPTYLAYHCVIDPERFKVSKRVIPVAFTRHKIDPSNLKSLMIATDGFDNHNETKLSIHEKEKPLPRSLHGEIWGKKGQFGLAKWMTVKSSQGYFEDDCAIVTVERKTQ